MNGPSLMSMHDVVDIRIHNAILLGHKKGADCCHAQQHGWSWRALCEISQTEKDKYCMRSLICGMEKIKQTSECNRFAAKENKLVVTK